MTISVRKLEQLSTAERDALLNRRPQSDMTVVETCRAVIDDVRRRGDDAVLEYTLAFDNVRLAAGELRVSSTAFDDARSRVTDALANAIDRSIRNVDRFHRAQHQPETRWIETEPGVWCGERWTPIETVCLYVPRGRGSFASVACMLGVPARIAGVGRVVVCTPPGRDGEVDAATLYACKQLGIDEVYKVGGAQAVAAVAYGTPSIPQCDKIIGPGNVYVSAAKRLLADEIDPGPPAGPSESLIICDESPDARQVAWNLLIEAEHGENSTAVLVTHSRKMADGVAAAIGKCIDQLTPQRKAYAETVLNQHGGILVTDSLEQSIEFANQFAAEHVALMVADPWTVHPKLTHAGEILFGEFPIISLANYAMGPNAILPTSRAARTASPVSVRDFVKATSLGFCTRQGYESLTPIVSVFSRDEGFSAHHLAAELWIDKDRNKERSDG